MKPVWKINDALLLCFLKLVDSEVRRIPMISSSDIVKKKTEVIRRPILA